MPTIALLMFNLSENEGIVRNIRSLSHTVDEIVVVDSSPPEQYEMLLTSVGEFEARVYRVLPIGYVDPLRPFGISKTESDYVLNLDADEELSDALRSDLRNLTGYDAYVLPRYETQLRSYTYHLRFFRRTAVRYCGRSYDFPEVAGRVGWLDKSHRIIHHVDHKSYFEDKSRARRYFTIENAERPFTRRYLEEALAIRMHGRCLSFPFTKRLRKSPDSLLSPPMVRGIIEFEFLRDLFLGRGFRGGTFNRRYSLAKWRFLCTLPEPERNSLMAIARNVQRSGGLFEFLGLNNPDYLDKLTSSFRWDLSGIDVYRNLLDYRHRLGRPPDSVYAK